MTHKNRKKSRIFMFLITGCSLLRAEGFSCSLGVLHGGLGISKLQILIKKIEIKFPAIIFSNFRSSNPAIRKNAGSGSVSGSALNQCGSETLLFSLYFQPVLPSLYIHFSMFLPLYSVFLNSVFYSFFVARNLSLQSVVLSLSNSIALLVLFILSSLSCLCSNLSSLALSLYQTLITRFLCTAPNTWALSE
jgi:hypothetical protein